MERFGSAPHTALLQRRSVRTIFSVFLAAILTVFLWTTLFTQPSHAQSATAEWEGASLRYDGKQFTGGQKAQRNQFPGISEGAVYYVASMTNTTQGQTNNTPRDVFILYLSPGVDPPAATSAQHVKFRFDPSTKTYSTPSDRQTVSIQGDHGQNETSCAVVGVGWFICSISTWLASGMDWVFNQIAGFMEVQPLSSDQDSGLYVGWNVMRNFANVAFIIAFLIIVYGQLSGAYAGTYGIKRLLPRLIVAAILVNISYIICALAVDLSNLLGYALQNTFIEMRNQIFQVDNETWNSEYMLSWESITGFVLSGGTAMAAVGLGALGALAGSGGTVVGLVFLLLPVLVGLLVAVLVVLLILAARQAIITILIIIAPLAFVAYLLPNTESWFSKWRSLFTTMLVFFPAFAVVFGGAQLAGAVIIQNASSINIAILGMIVQVAPLVITPFLLKFSGSLLGRIAGLVNNPNKGLMDRTRSFADKRAELHRNRGITGGKFGDKPGELKRRNFMRKASLMANNFNRNTDEKLKNSRAAYDNTYHGSRAYQKIHDNASVIGADKDIIDANLAAHTETQKATAGSVLHGRAIKLESAKQNLEAEKNRATLEVEKVRVDQASDLHINTLRAKTSEATVEQLTAQNARMMEEYKSGKASTTNPTVDALMNTMSAAAIQTSAEKQGAVSAQYETARSISEAINEASVAGSALRKIAAGVSGTVGETRARAQAVSTLNKLDADVLKSNMELLKANATQAKTTIKAYSQGIVTDVIEGRGGALDEDQIRAAFQLQAEEKNMSLFEKARGSVHVDQDIVSEIIAENVGNFKAAGGFHLQADPSLNVQALGTNFEREMAKARINTLASVSPENIAGLKAGWVEALADPAQFKTALSYMTSDKEKATLVDAYMSVKKALTNDDVLGKLDNREGFVRTIEEILAKHLNEAPTLDPRPKI